MCSVRRLARGLVLILFVVVGGCASSELNYNTVDLATSSNDLMTQQVLYNLANFIDSDLAYPAQIVINSGTATTSDTANASFTGPLTAAVTGTNQVVQTVAASPSTATTRLGTSVTAGQSLGVSGTAARTQNWSYAPIANAFEASRLMALYRFAVDNNESALLENYPKIFKSSSHTRNVCLTDTDGNPIIVKHQAGTAPINADSARVEGTFSRCATSYGANNSFQLTAGSDSESTMVPDRYYLHGPRCVVCLPSQYAPLRKLFVNPRLKGGWLHWRALPGASGIRPDTYQPGDISLGRYGHYEIFAAGTQQSKVPDFVVFILAASTQTDSSGTAGVGGGGSSQAAKQALQGLLSGQCVQDGAGVLTCF